MERKKSIRYALKTMELEGFTFTVQEKELWDKIASGELPRSVAKADAAEFDRLMREKYPEKFDQGNM